jgi:hypothetical protein
VKKEMGVRRILPKSQVNQDATRVEAGAEWRRVGMLLLASHLTRRVAAQQRW